MKLYKLGHLARPEDRHSLQPFVYPNLWCRRDRGTDPGVVLAPAAEHVDLVLELAGELGEPIDLLYVLLESALGRDEGRYRCEAPMDAFAVEQFLRDFCGYLETDGRHHVRLHGPHGGLVYDNHNLIHAWGDVHRLAEVAHRRGLLEGQVSPPQPHVHRIHASFDLEEDRLFERIEWVHQPLEQEDR